jgi:uracil-DNA glycosylase
MMVDTVFKDFLQRIPLDYQELLGDFLSNNDHQQHLAHLAQLENEARALYPGQIFPEQADVFKALTQTPVDAVKVILLGQDPYHSPGLAQGLAFSVPQQIPITSKAYPSSLRNISKALFLDGFDTLTHGNLHDWAKQGVLLLNTSLTVAMGVPHSHQAWGWQVLTDAIIQSLSKKQALVWLLWGKVAQKKAGLICGDHAHLVLTASHPSGLGAYQTNTPFLYRGDTKACGHFRKTNDWLIAQAKSPIVWSSSLF